MSLKVETILGIVNYWFEIYNNGRVYTLVSFCILPTKDEGLEVEGTTEVQDKYFFFFTCKPELI